MRRGSSLSMAAIAWLLISFPLRAPAQHSTAVRPDPGQSGIDTGRLKPQLLPLWASIEKIAQAHDDLGIALYPTLSCLWQWANAGRHTVYVKFSDQANNRNEYVFTAAETSLEECSPAMQNCRAVITVNLGVIRNSQKRVLCSQLTGRVSFVRQGVAERCAEILGHELAHAYFLLEDSSYAAAYHELKGLTAEWQDIRRNIPGRGFWTAAMQEKLNRMQALMGQLEAPAESVDTAIRMELGNSTNTPKNSGAIGSKAELQAAQRAKSRR